MDKPAEILLYEFLQERIDALSPDDVLYSVRLQDTIYQSITKNDDRVLRISDAVSTFSPQAGGGIKEFDAQLVLVAMSRVKGADKTARTPAVQDVFDMQAAVYGLLYGDSTLGGRVCDLQLERGARGYDIVEAEPWATAHIPLIINPSGARIHGT